LLLFTRKNKVIAESNGLQKYSLKNYELNYERKEIIPFHSSSVVSHFDTDRNESFCQDNIQHIKTCNVK
jgi:hypothetical protein